MSFSDQLLLHFTGLDFVIFGVNLLLLIFSKTIVTDFGSKSEVPKTKLLSLRVINVILIILYISPFFLDNITKQISQTGLSLLLGFLAVHFAQIVFLYKFGRVREIDEVKYRSETYQSEVFSLLFLLITFITIFVLVINIWGLTDWLKATSVLGILAIIVFSTKDVWAPDNINGLILLYNGDIEPGAVVQITELDLLAIALQTTLTQTTFRDLRSKHLIVIANSNLRNRKIEVLSKSPSSGLLWTIDFNIGYGVSVEQVETFFEEVWKKAIEESTAINPEKPATVKLLATADHAVTWRFVYWVKNIYSVLDTEFTVNKYAYAMSLKEGIDLATPLTHSVDVHQHEH